MLRDFEKADWKAVQDYASDPEVVRYVDLGPYPDFAKLTNPCIERGIIKTVKVGEATLELIKLRELIDLYVEYLNMDPDLFYDKSYKQGASAEPDKSAREI